MVMVALKVQTTVVDLVELDRDQEGVPSVGGDGDAAAVAFEKDGTSWWMVLALPAVLQRRSGSQL